MRVEDIVGLVIAIGLLAYLVWALIRSDKVG